MTTQHRTFIALLLGLAVIGVGCWFGWRAWAWPTKTLANGWKIRVSRSWQIVDGSFAPEQDRPLLSLHASATDKDNTLLVTKIPIPVATQQQFVTEMTKAFAVQQPNAKVIGEGFLTPKKSYLPYVLLHANNHFFLATRATKDGATYYFVARYTDASNATFGASILSSLRSLHE